MPFCLKSRQKCKTRHFGKITEFDENPGFRDFLVCMIFYCPCQRPTFAHYLFQKSEMETLMVNMPFRLICNLEH